MCQSPIKGHVVAMRTVLGSSISYKVAIGTQHLISLIMEIILFNYQGLGDKC